MIFTSSTIGPTLWHDLCSRVGPGMVTLECGSGLSTLLFQAAGCRHTALEHDPRFAPPLHCVKCVPLVGNPPWYQWEPSRPYDLILVDGPPQAAGGRLGLLRVVGRLLRPETTIVLDDTDRAEEQELVRRICASFGYNAEEVGPRHAKDFGRHFTILTPAGRPR